MAIFLDLGMRNSFSAKMQHIGEGITHQPQQLFSRKKIHCA